MICLTDVCKALSLAQYNTWKQHWVVEAAWIGGRVVVGCLGAVGNWRGCLGLLVGGMVW